MSRKRCAPLPSVPKLTRKCSLGCPILDSFLNGGIPCGSITELVGECGSGKTQICLQVLLSAQMPLSQGGLNASSVYIYTESYFPFKRLQQLAKGFLDAGKLSLGILPTQKKFIFPENGFEPHCLEEDSTMTGLRKNMCPYLDNDKSNSASITHGLVTGSGDINPQGNGAGILQDHELHGTLSNEKVRDCHHVYNDISSSYDQTYSNKFPPKRPKISEVDVELHEYNHPCDNIFVQSIQNVEELNVYLDQVHLLLSRSLIMPVRLIVIDSIAALFRSDFNNSLKDLTMRTEWFFKISSKLKTYAHDYDIAVLVTNQVVDDVGSESLITQNSVHGMLSGNFGSLISSGRKVMPALGIGWSHCINTRLFLSRFSPPEWQAQPEYQHIGSSKASGRSIYIADPKQVNSDDLGSGYQISVLQQLESELPDDLLLTLSPKKCPSMNTVSGKPNVPYSYLERKTANISGHGYLQHGSLEKTDDVKDFGRPPLNSLRRKLQVIFAPHLPPSSCEFMVTTNQIFGVTTSSPVQPVCNKECKY